MIDGQHMEHLRDVNLHQTDESHRDFGTSPAIRGGFQGVRSSSDARSSSDSRDLSRFWQSRGDAWRLRRASNSHRTGIASDDVGEEHQDIDVHNLNRPTHLDMRSDDWEDSWKNSTIVVRSNRDRGAFGEIMAHHHVTIDGPRSSCDRGHQPHFPTGSNGHKNREKIPFKKTMYLPLFLNF